MKLYNAVEIIKCELDKLRENNMLTENDIPKMFEIENNNFENYIKKILDKAINDKKIEIRVGVTDMLFAKTKPEELIFIVRAIEESTEQSEFIRSRVKFLIEQKKVKIKSLEMESWSC